MPRPRPRRALTLLETLLATSLFAVLMGMMYWFYGATLETRDDGLKRSRDVQLAWVLLARMAEEIRLASGSTPGYGVGLVGFEDSISVNTLVLPDEIVNRRQSLGDEQIAAQFDLQEVRYYIAWDEENLDEEGNPRALGLVRRVTKTFNRGVYIDTDAEQEEVEDEEALAVKEELYAPEIKFLELRYFDGAGWWEDWQLTGGNTLPVLVRITVGFTPVLPEEYQEMDLVEDDFLRDEVEQEELEEDRFTIFVRPIQADPNPIGVRLQREASAFSESEGGL